MKKWKIMRNGKLFRTIDATFDGASFFCDQRMKKCPHEEWTFR